MKSDKITISYDESGVEDVSTNNKSEVNTSNRFLEINDNIRNARKKREFNTKILESLKMETCENIEPPMST